MVVELVEQVDRPVVVELKIMDQEREKKTRVGKSETTGNRTARTLPLASKAGKKIGWKRRKEDSYGWRPTVFGVASRGRDRHTRDAIFNRPRAKILAS